MRTPARPASSTKRRIVAALASKSAVCRHCARPIVTVLTASSLRASLPSVGVHDPAADDTVVRHLPPPALPCRELTPCPLAARIQLLQQPIRRVVARMPAPARTMNLAHVETPLGTRRGRTGVAA